MRSHKFLHGFTLIELLVVISIIALLLSIMMPALSKARELSRRVVCQSNVKQQFLACSLYVEDYKGLYPTPSYDVPSASDPFGLRLAGYAWGGALGSKLSVQGLLNKYMGRDGKVSKNVEGVLKVFNCPSDSGFLMRSQVYWSGDLKPRLSDPQNWGSSYFYNAGASNRGRKVGVSVENSPKTGWALYGKRTTEVKTPARVILAGDGPMWSYLAGENPYAWTYWHHKTETAWTNVVFSDGHVGFIQMRPPNEGGDPGSYQCSSDGSWTFFYDGSRSIKR